MRSASRYSKNMRTTLNIADALLENAKLAASERGVTVGQIFEDALRGYLSAHKLPPPKVFRLHTVKGTLVQPERNLDRTSQLLVEDDEARYGQRL